MDWSTAWSAPKDLLLLIVWEKKGWNWRSNKELVMICILFHVALSDQNEFNVFFVFVFMYRLWKRFWCLERFCQSTAICFLKECHSASCLVLASCIIYIVSFSQSKKFLMIYATIVQCISLRTNSLITQLALCLFYGHSYVIVRSTWLHIAFFLGPGNSTLHFRPA